MFQLVWAKCSMQCAALVIPNKNSNHSNQTTLPFQFFFKKLRTFSEGLFYLYQEFFLYYRKIFSQSKKQIPAIY